MVGRVVVKELKRQIMTDTLTLLTKSVDTVQDKLPNNSPHFLPSFSPQSSSIAFFCQSQTDTDFLHLH